NVDLLIARKFGFIADDQLNFEWLFEDSCVVAAGAENPWSRRRKIELAELMDESWVLPPPKHALGPIYSAAFRASGLDYPRATVFTVPPEVRLSIVAAGPFLSIFPTSVLTFPAARPGIKVLPVELPTARVPNGIVAQKKRALSPVAQLFVAQVREVAKPLAITLLSGAAAWPLTARASRRISANCARRARAVIARRWGSRPPSPVRHWS